MKESDRVKVLTHLGPDKSGAIALVSVDGLEASKLSTWLFDKYRIVNVAINHPEFSGLRITPSVYTTLGEVDTFGDAMLTAIKRGIV